MANRKITPKDAAAIIGIGYQTLINWKNTGAYANRLKFHKRPNNRLYLMSSNVEKFAKWYAK